MALSRQAQRRLATFVPPLLVALVALPFVLRQNSWWEWTTTYWLLERQADHVSSHGVPTLFLHTSAGGFYPFYIYYAGFTTSVLAYPAALIGAWPVFAATCVAAPVAGYLGIWWTARNLGLSERLAVLPGLAFAATPYMVTDLYGRGSWAELMAINTVPVLLGGLTALLWHPERGRGRALAGLIASAAVLAGTHNITLLFAAIVLPLLVLALLPLAPRGTSLAAIARRVGLSVAAIALGAGLTGAWLVPNLASGRETWAAQPQINQTLLASSTGLDTVDNILSITPAGLGGWLYVQPPVLPMAWAAVALATILLLLRRRGARVAASAAGLCGLATGIVVVIVHPQWWPHLPNVLQSIQNPSRLVPEVALVGVVAIIVALVTAPPGRIRLLLTTALVAAVGAQVYMSARIAIDTQPQSALPSTPLRHDDIAAADEPPAFATAGLFPPYQFRVATGRSLKDPTRNATLDFADLVTSDVGVLGGSGRVGDRLLAGVVWSRFVRVDGDVRAAGRTAKGDLVLQVVRSAPDGSWRGEVRGACSGLCLHGPWSLAVGRLISLLSALVLAALAGTGIRRRRRRRSAAPATPVDEPRTLATA